jgi:hypothetical protein
MKKKVFTVAVLSFLLLFSSSFAQTELIGRSEVEYIYWGGVEYGWDDIWGFKNVKMQKRPMGRLDITLDDNSPIMDDKTELLLHFDRIEQDFVSLDSPDYRIQKVNIFPSLIIKKHGEGSAGFLHYSNRIEILPLEGSLFFSDPVLQNFTIDFFLYPTNVHDSIVVFSWHAPTVDTDTGFSGLKLFFDGGRLRWQFDNVFHDREGIPATITIGEKDITPLNEWHHHALHYNSDEGLITLYFDGEESNLFWVTQNRREDGSQLQGKFSRYLAVPITLGDHFLGYIDEFRISREHPHFFTGEYRSRGLVLSKVIDLKHRGTKLVKILWDSIEEQGTAIRVFCRISDRYFLPTADSTVDLSFETPQMREVTYLDRSSENVSGSIAGWKRVNQPPEWIGVRNDVEFVDRVLKGRYLQWKVELFGTGGVHSPLLKNIGVVIEPDPPPTPPILLEAHPLDGAAKLTWIKNKEIDISGYKVYYGDSSLNYFGSGSNLGDSPVFVYGADGTDFTMSFAMEGLENEQVYFFSITAVDDSNQESGFSKEFIVRPSLIHGEE